jgi:two-component system LytT family response regulator
MATTNLRVIIVDDEPLARSRIRNLLAKENGIDILAECGDGAAAVQAIIENKPDLVFLDIQMPEMNGFDVLALLPPKNMPAIIFITAYDQFAMRAFTVQALDYLLKPCADERFSEALQRARSRLGQQRSLQEQKKISALLEDVECGPRQRLLIKDKERVRVVLTSEIDFITAEDYYVRLHIGRVSFLVRDSLQHLEKSLDPKKFVRIHRSYLVQVERIRELQPLCKGEYMVLLRDGTRLPMGSSYKKLVFELLRR